MTCLTSSWPEVVGLPFAEAEKVIMADRPDCKVVHIKPVMVQRKGLEVGCTYDARLQPIPCICDHGEGRALQSGNSSWLRLVDVSLLPKLFVATKTGLSWRV